jgi:hypothetical protein
MQEKNDEKNKNPKTVEQQDSPEPVRPTTPLEDEGQDIASLDDPPQAEGDRESGS